MANNNYRDKEKKGGNGLTVEVRNNNVEKALRDLKKKMMKK